MKIKPLGSRIVVQELEANEVTKSGIILSGMAKEKPQEAKVVAVGRINDNGIKIGDKIFYSKYAGNDVKVDGKEYIILNQEDILAIVE